MESRQYFINQVAQTIQENHAAHDESFIFGISGKWGEGKTHFLNGLKLELERLDPTFKIYKVNPWKFATDKTSFLRNFLKVFYKKPSNVWVRIRKYLNNENTIEALDLDTSENHIHPGWLLVLVLYLVSLAWMYLAVQYAYIPLDSEIVSFINQWKWLGSLILLPIFVSFIGKVVTVQKSNHAISTLDRFDMLLDETLVELSGRKEKPIVFVDDLDRVTPEIARTVLDNLRTFFDKKQISFVVTGDHTVLERYLGKDLLPDAELPEQLEEGRRFLKKIFNVYWRLPLPIEQEMDKFLDSQFSAKAGAIAEILPEEADRKIFASYLRKYFDKNFRQIIRFIDTVIFTFQIVQEKSNVENAEEKRYIKELLYHPLLVIRILMIQELCAPLFDEISGNYQLLGDLEYAVEKKDTAKINSILDPYQEKMSPFQTDFIKKFIYEDPRFYRSSSLTVSDIRPFLFLAADASFGDSRGPSSEDFLTILKVGDPAQLKNILLSSGDQKATDASKAFKAQIPTSTPDQVFGYVRTLVSALKELPPEYAVHSIFAKELADVDYTFINAQPQPIKLEALKDFWTWLDQLDLKLAEPYIGKFPFLSEVVDFSPISPTEGGPFTTRMLSTWMRGYFDRNNMDALNKMSEMFPKVKEELRPIIKEALSSIAEPLAAGIISDSNIDVREKRLQLLKDYTSNGVEILRGKIFEQAHVPNGEIVDWAKAKASSDLWTKEEVEKEVLERLKETNNFGDLNNVLHFINNHEIGTPKRIWQKISSEQEDILLSNLPSIIDSPYAKISPPEDRAAGLMEKAIKMTRELSDEGQQAQWLNYLKYGKWLWSSLTKGPTKTNLPALSKSTNEQIKQNFKEMLDTWKG